MGTAGRDKMTQGSGSRWPGFFRLTMDERIEQLADRLQLDAETRRALENLGYIK